MLSATALGTGDSVQVTVTANEAAAALLASLNSSDTAGPLTISVRSGDSVELFSALTVSSDATNSDQVGSDSLSSVRNATIHLVGLSLGDDTSGGVTFAFDRVVFRPASCDYTGFDDRLATFDVTFHFDRDAAGDSSNSEEPRFQWKIEPALPELPQTISGALPPRQRASASNISTEEPAGVESEVAASATSEREDSVGVGKSTSTDLRSRQASAETVQAVQLVPGRFLLLVSASAGRKGSSSVAVSYGGTGSSAAGELALSGLTTLLSSLVSPDQPDTQASCAASGLTFETGELAQPDSQHTATELAVEAGTPTVTLAASLPAIALQQTAVSLAGMFEDLLLTLNSLLHAIGVAVGSESRGTQAPVAPTVAPVFPGVADPRQFVAGSPTIQSVPVDVSGSGKFQLEPFSRRENSIQTLTLEFAPRHGQLLVRDLRKGMLEFEAIPGFDGADSAVWQATLDDGSSIQGTIVFLVDSSATQAAAAQASLFDIESPVDSAPENTATPQAVPASDRDAAFSSDELLSRLLR